MTLNALNARRRSPALSRPSERGVTLIDALVALLLFSLGILGLMGAQSAAIQTASQSRYRAIAAVQAETLVSRMWLSDRTAATLQASFAGGSSGSKGSGSSGGTGYTVWKEGLDDSGLPNVSATVSFATVNSSSLATVQISWTAPGETTAHTYTSVTQLQ